ncbi:hypothetical protein SAMN04488063_3266 [Halopelagius inordinatus]|uniref:Uncharacterized protein n=1 Tax=Halopelagius inordinatus TaxID=553467 RepID=A0A1I2VSI9_9EURY|nr:hypothetical protein [Halopelagius inordinatus]SFG91287.1 hypothetical protein SAMN04488063_3266 [Halopelagius inordinatus]
MCPLTRRRALRGVVGSLAFLAGCSGEDSNGGASAWPTTSRPNAETVTDPDAAVVRLSGEESAVWREAEGTDENPRRTRLGNEFLTDARAADSLSFAADAENVAEARSFLDSTDYDAETVYVEQTAVGECFRRELCSVRWTDTEIRTRYARRFRDVDASCETDARDTVAWFIRVPDTIDPDAIDGYGSRYGSDGCRPPGERRVDGREDGDSADTAGTAASAVRPVAPAEAER